MYLVVLVKFTATSISPSFLPFVNVGVSGRCDLHFFFQHWSARTQCWRHRFICIYVVHTFAMHMGAPKVIGIYIPETHREFYVRRLPKLPVYMVKITLAMYPSSIIKKKNT